MGNGKIMLNGTGLLISGAAIYFPDYEIKERLGGGANGVVFRAWDRNLERDVALKVWGPRGLSRAQDESKKIAALTHDCIVATHRFSWVGNHPYCVMEYVPGESLKSWLMAERPVEAKIAIWKGYARALQHIHSLGVVHGDPHTGNVLVGPGVNVKVADAGTSIFWDDHSKFETREKDLIIETAHRLFESEKLSELWAPPDAVNHQDALTMFDIPVEFLSRAYGLPDHDMRSLAASYFSDQILAHPFFRLDAVIRHIDAGGVTDGERVLRRINANLAGRTSFMDGDEKLSHQTQERYSARMKEAAALVRYMRGAVSAPVA
ncbi:hypothetical protein FJP65_05630 [Stenotrophomonas maltophilia]|nr:hypothetical protein FJP65_05630 [Stenotrophomonas maltophilia]